MLQKYDFFSIPQQQFSPVRENMRIFAHEQ